MAGVEDEDAVLQQLGLGQARAVGLALDEPRQHVAARIARLAAPFRHQAAEIVEELGHGRVAAGHGLLRDGRLERAEDRQRPAAQRATVFVRHVQQVADDLDRDGAGEVVDEVDPAFFLRPVQQAVDESDQVRLHAGDRRRRQGAGDEPPDPGVQRRVVEDQARRVMLVERRRAVLGPELLLLVGAEALGVLVDRDEVVVARQEVGPVRTAVDRIPTAQRVIGRKGIVVERVGQLQRIEGRGDLRGAVGAKRRGAVRARVAVQGVCHGRRLPAPRGWKTRNLRAGSREVNPGLRGAPTCTEIEQACRAAREIGSPGCRVLASGCKAASRQSQRSQYLDPRGSPQAGLGTGFAAGRDAGRLGFRPSDDGVWSERRTPGRESTPEPRRAKIPGDHCARPEAGFRDPHVSSLPTSRTEQVIAKQEAGGWACGDLSRWLRFRGQAKSAETEDPSAMIGFVDQENFSYMASEPLTTYARTEPGKTGRGPLAGRPQ